MACGLRAAEPWLSWRNSLALLPNVSPEIPNGPRGKPVTRRTVLSRRDALDAEVREAATARICDEVEVLLQLETRGSDHAAQLRERLAGHGYRLDPA